VELDRTSRGAIVAPAGHGKTHLIARRISEADSNERLLVLTHTNVAVRALRRRLTSTSAGLIQVETLDAMALRIATSFPATSLVPKEIAGSQADWEDAVRPGALRALRSPAIRDAFVASYTNVIVDEFQDCTRAQVALILALAERVPTVVLGDPMQAVYQFKPSEVLDWESRTAGHPALGSLEVPWRWQGRPELGEWILTSRAALRDGHQVVVGRGTAAVVRDLNKPIAQAGLSNVLQGLAGSTAVITGNSGNVSRLRDIARGNKWSRCEVFETAAPSELASLGAAHSGGTPPDQALALIAFAKACMSKVGEVSGAGACEMNLRHTGAAGKSPSALAVAIRRFLGEPVGVTAKGVLECLAADPITHTFRPSLLRLAQRAYDRVGEGGCEGFEPSVREVLEARKHVDEQASGPSVGTSLRLKGLEFDNVVIVDPEAFGTIEQLYVAISRPTSQIVIALEPGQQLGSRIIRR
jgi:hypothetical protein